jgi:aminoglycoside phosphotransferase (APT) family kinase protein
MGDHPGISTESVSNWLAAALPDAAPPFDFELIAAGGSNLTFRLRDGAGRQWALRRPPVGRALATAHDMSREFRIIAALATDGSVPVPEAVAFCDDPAVTGAAFYVMSFVDGLILRDRSTASGLSSDQAAAATQALVAAQVGLHSLDFEAVGLGDLARHDGYVQRQLKRWQRQVAAAGVRELPLHAELHARLVASAPPDTRAPSLVHGDFRFDNCVLGSDGSVAAILDWELATIGDPVADFAWSLRYWADPDDELYVLTDAPTLASSFERRSEYQRSYERASGFDLSDLDYFEVFSWWKQASIMEGVYARRVAGSSGGMTHQGDPGRLAARVEALLAHAADLASGLM